MPTLDWIGKDKVINHHKDVPYKVLERKYSFDESGMHKEEIHSNNMIIHGDNLEALKSLLPQYEGKIKCIYIDPPYNTGNEGWIYNDNVNDPKIKKWLGEVVGKEGEDLSRHDKWLYQTFKSETEGYSLASKYAENLQNNSLDKEAINLQLQEAKKFLQDNIKGISRESDNFAQMFYYCGIIYGLDRKYNCGDYEFVKVGIEVRGYIINVQNGDMDDELEADLYDKLTKLTADDIQEVVNAIDN